MQNVSALPSSHALLREFAKRHELRLTHLVSRELVAIRSTSIANIVVNEAYAGLDAGVLADPAVGLLLNMLHRNFEHAEAAIVAFVTGNGASADVIARASIESSVNLLYIFAGDRARRLQAYFEHYLKEVDRQVDKWRDQILRLSPSDAAVHQQGANDRHTVNASMRALLRSLMGNPQEQWPRSIAERFKALGDELTYRTFYARMSSEAHADAEETLRYFVGLVQDDPSLLEAMALETIWTNRFHIHYATALFLKASIAYAMSYSLGAVQFRLERELAAVERALIEIGSHVGAGIEAKA